MAERRRESERDRMRKWGKMQEWRSEINIKTYRDWTKYIVQKQQKNMSIVCCSCWAIQFSTHAGSDDLAMNRRVAAVIKYKHWPTVSQGLPRQSDSDELYACPKRKIKLSWKSMREQVWWYSVDFFYLCILFSLRIQKFDDSFLHLFQSKKK